MNTRMLGGLSPREKPEGPPRSPINRDGHQAPPGIVQLLGAIAFLPCRRQGSSGMTRGKYM